MILFTHILIGAATTKVLGVENPGVALLSSAASHYLADKIPHWQYRLKSDMGYGKQNIDEVRKRSLFWRDYFIVGGEALVGALVLLSIFRPHSITDWAFWGLVVFGSVLPDFLQFVHRKVDFKILAWHQRFHNIFHSKVDLDAYPKLGIPFQILLDLAALYILF